MTSVITASFFAIYCYLTREVNTRFTMPSAVVGFAFEVRCFVFYSLCTSLSTTTLENRAPIHLLLLLVLWSRVCSIFVWHVASDIQDNIYRSYDPDKPSSISNFTDSSSNLLTFDPRILLPSPLFVFFFFFYVCRFFVAVVFSFAFVPQTSRTLSYSSFKVHFHRNLLDPLVVQLRPSILWSFDHI